MTTYAAPAARPLTVLHIPAPGADLGEPGQLTACCGLPMDPADLWAVVERRPGDRVCPGTGGDHDPGDRDPDSWVYHQAEEGIF